MFKRHFRQKGLIALASLCATCALCCGPFYGLNRSTELTSGPTTLVSPLRTTFDMELVGEFKDRMSLDDANVPHEKRVLEHRDVEQAIHEAMKERLGPDLACRLYLQSLKAERSEAISLCERIIAMPVMLRKGMGALAHYRLGRLLMADSEKWGGGTDAEVKARIRKIKGHFKSVGERLEEGDVSAGGIAPRWATWHAYMCAMILPTERLLLLGEADFGGAFRAYISQPVDGESNALNSCHHLARRLANSHQYGVCATDVDLRKLLSIYILSGGKVSGHTSYLGQDRREEPQDQDENAFAAKQWLRVLKERSQEPGLSYSRFAALLYNAGEYEEAAKILYTQCDAKDPLAALYISRIELRRGYGNADRAYEALKKIEQTTAREKYVKDDVKYFPQVRDGWYKGDRSEWWSEPRDYWPRDEEIEPRGFKSTGWTLEAFAGAKETKFIQMNFHNEESLKTKVASELSTLNLLRDNYKDAALGFWNSHRNKDFAYVAECLLTVEELKSLVDDNWPENFFGFFDPKPTPDDKKLTFLTESQDPRTLLARRLWRAGRMREAVPYFPMAQREDAKYTIGLLESAADTNLDKVKRADCYWNAAFMLVYCRLDPLFCEFGQSWTTGVLWHDSPQHPYFRLKQLERFGPRDAYVENSMNFFSPSKEEHRRLNKWLGENMATPDIRHRSEWHESLRLCVEAAKLLPENDPRGAYILQWGGNLVRYSNPKGAVPAYRLLVTRFGKTQLGKAASEKNWFSNDDPPFDANLLK